jgi:hypothetical protein
LNAQGVNSIESQGNYKNNHISINILSSIDPFTPRWKVGYVKSLSPKWKLGLDIGYGTQKMVWSNYSWFTYGEKIGEDYKLWEIRPELYYIINPEKKVEAYFSGELFYIHHKDVYSGNYFVPRNGGFFRYESANYLRQKYGLHIKTGMFIDIGKRLGLNIYTGLGLRFRDNSFTNIINPIPRRDHRDMIVIDYNEYDGLYFGLNGSLGFKLYFRF